MNPLKLTQLIKLVLFLAVVVGSVIYLGAATESSHSGVIHINNKEVAAAFEKGADLLATNNFKINAGRREMPGEVEVHDRDTDIFHIIEGSATFVTGGKIVQPRTISPGETRAKEIVGGDTRHLAKGDIIVIPTGVPHWFKEVQGPLLYFVVKVSH